MKKIRLNYFTFPKFQAPLIMITVTIFAIYSGFLWWMVNNSYSYLRSLGEKAKFAQGHSYFKFIEFQEGLVINNLLIAGGISFAILIIAMTYYSHRMAGPLYRLKMYFTDRVNDAGPEEIKFRKGDYLKELEPVINKVMTRK